MLQLKKLKPSVFAKEYSPEIQLEKIKQLLQTIYIMSSFQDIRTSNKIFTTPQLSQKEPTSAQAALKHFTRYYSDSA